ncbi:MAG: type II toxin-antitoxin system RelE family toxin [Dehalococcoidia bacterium]
MNWRVVWSDRAARDLRRLDKIDAQRVLSAVRRLATEDYGDVKRLQGAEQLWRLRVGDLRVVFVYDHTSRAMDIARVLPRDRAYRR